VHDQADEGGRLSDARFDPSRRTSSVAVILLTLAIAGGRTLAVFGGFALAGCSEGSAKDTAPPNAAASVPPASSGHGTIEVVDLAGLGTALEQRRGKPLIVNFWAMWCPPCVEELPELIAAAQAGQIELVGVSYDLMMPGSDKTKIEPKLRKFLTDRKLALSTLVFDAPDLDAINAKYDLPGPIPATLAIDASGKIVDRENGAAERARFDEMIQRAKRP
jgi:thiol-disulfide isomerase/thioredoxin